MADNELSYKLYLIEEEKVLGPAETTIRVLEAALSEPSDYIVKLDSHREVPHKLVIHKFLKQLRSLEDPYKNLLTGLKSVMTKAPRKDLKKYRQEQLAEEMAATFSTSQFYQDAINVQGFPSEILKELLRTKDFVNHGGRRGWDILLPLQAKKFGCKFTTIPFYPEEIVRAKDRNFGVRFQNDNIKVILKRFSATN